MNKKIVSAALIVFAVLLSNCGGSSSSGGGGNTTTTRNLTGSISEGSLAGAIVKTPKGLVIKNIIAACTDVQVCCTGYTGGAPTVADVAADCTFEVPLPLNTYCGCWLASGEDTDGDGCGDDYVGSMGCAENKYQGLIPTGGDGSEEDIDIGSSSLQGLKVVSAENPCAQVDSDDDGVVDSTDTDDDGDGSDDSSDISSDEGCTDPTLIDSNEDGIPDFYQPDVWDELDDDDEDGLPDFCDTTEDSCEASDEDLDGNCVPDLYDLYDRDDDGDGYPSWDDCNDDDNTVTNSCYSDEYCDSDSDGDGYGLCDDCDDTDSGSTYECYGDDFCDEDEDEDGLGYCADCDDEDASIGTQCYDASYCEEDNDGDEFNACIDCDDFDEDNTDSCYDDVEGCASDSDSDGYNACLDCDDTDSLVTDSCYTDDSTDDVTCDESTIACDNTAQCEFFAAEVDGDDFEIGSVSCEEGCCVAE